MEDMFMAFDKEIEIDDLEIGQNITIHYWSGDIVTGKVIEVTDEYIEVYLEVASELMTPVRLDRMDIDSIVLKNIDKDDLEDDEE